MAQQIRFTKMHGAGNDYIYIDTNRFPIDSPQEKAVEWSKPHSGIGSDGIILIAPSDIADFSMRIFNADGSEAMMCGNGSRCVGKYVYDNGLTDKTEIKLETLSGIKTLKLHLQEDKVATVTVDMGSPLLTAHLGLGKEYGEQTATEVSMGNPHLVIFVEDIAKIDIAAIGSKLEYHPHFPNRTNVEFAQVIDADTIRMRVWERGSGITQACGTGACATAVAGFLNGLTGRKSNIIMDGGTVAIEWDEATGHVLMTGPAVKVFDGEIEA